MCRNIRTLHNFDPPATDEEIQGTPKDREVEAAKGQGPLGARFAA